MAETNGEFPTVIGPDAIFKGELQFEKGLRLMGKFEGKINTPGRVHVGKEATMNADVDAGGIIVEGRVRGNFIASDRVELKNSARYEGDLQASKLVVDEGATFSGQVQVGPDVVKNRSPGSGGSQQQPGPVGERGTAANVPGLNRGPTPQPAPGSPTPAQQPSKS